MKLLLFKFLYFCLFAHFFLLKVLGFSFESPQFDKFKSYHQFELPNKLKVLIVNDHIQKNGVILSVDVGSSYEPKNIPGLAHLLEHMLFFSSKKYPNEYYFKHYLAQVQGFSNAHTWDDETLFYFHIADNKLQSFEKAIDIFSRFFIDPIFTHDAISREVYAVHNEYEGFLLNEQWRFQELLRNIANKDSIFNHFQIGDLKHLANKNIDILKEVTQFFQSFYSADHMKLVIYTNHDKDSIKNIIKNSFGLIPFHKNWQYPSHFNKKDKELRKSNAFDQKNTGIFAWYKSLFNKKMLSIVFPLTGPALNIDKKVKPIDFIKKLINRKGKNSLYSILKKKGFIDDITMNFMEKHVDFKIISVKISLNPLITQQQTLETLKIFFSYIKYISKNGLNEKIYRQIARQYYLDFLYEEKKSFTEELKFLMNIFKEYGYCDNNIVEEIKNLKKFDKKEIEKYLDIMKSPNQAIIVFSSPILTNETPFTSIFRFHHNAKTKNSVKNNGFFEKKLNFYDTTMNFFYATDRIPSDYLKYMENNNIFLLNPQKPLLENAYSPQSLKIITECSVLNIERNEYFFDEKCLENEKSKDIHNNFPELAYKNPSNTIEIWYKSQRTFSTPKIASIIQLNYRKRETISKQIFSEILSKTFESLYWQDLDEIKEGQNEIAFESKEDNLVLKIFAFSDRFYLILMKTLTLLSQMKFTKKMFFQHKINLLGRSLWNSKEKSFLRLFHYVDCVLNAKNLRMLENENKIINKYSYKQFISDYSDFLNTLSVKAVVVGNIVEKHASFIGESLKDFVKGTNINGKSRRSAILKSQPYYILRKNINSLTVKELSTNKEDRNNAILTLFVKESYKPKDFFILNKIINIMETEAFKFLRTKHQIGYELGLRMIKTPKLLGIFIFAKGSRYNIQQMEGLINQFLLYFKQFINNHEDLFTKQQEISQNKTNETQNKKIVFLNPNLKANAQEYFEGILNDKYTRFKQKTSEEIKIKEINDFYDDIFFNKIKAMSFQLYSFKTKVLFEAEKLKTQMKNNQKVVYSLHEMESFLEKKR